MAGGAVDYWGSKNIVANLVAYIPIITNAPMIRFTTRYVLLGRRSLAFGFEIFIFFRVKIAFPDISTRVPY